MKINSKNFMRLMRVIRKKRGMGSRQFAQEVDIPRSTIQNWERGSVMIPLDRAVQIADYLGYKIQFVKKEKRSE